MMKITAFAFFIGIIKLSFGQIKSDSFPLLLKDTAKISEVPIFSKANTILDKTSPQLLEDPLRAAVKMAGVRGTGDITNALIIRGHSPKLNNFYINGLEVPSPNHFYGQGTNGIIPICQPKFLQSTTILNEANEVKFGNALGGIVNYNTRQNTFKNEAGIEFSNILGYAYLQTYLTKSKNLFLYAGYRYSTLALMEKIGYGVGNYKIPYQDYNVSLIYNSKKMGQFIYWGIGGYSSIKPINEKGYFNGQDFYQKYATTAHALQHKFSINSKHEFETALYFTQYSDLSPPIYRPDYYQYQIASILWTGKSAYTYQNREYQFSAKIAVKHKLSAKLNLEEGLQLQIIPQRFYEYNLYDLTSNDTSQYGLKKFQGKSMIGQSVGNAKRFIFYQNSHYAISAKLIIDAGFQARLTTDNDAFTVDPHVNLTWTPTKIHSLKFHTGLVSFTEKPWLNYKVYNSNSWYIFSNPFFTSRKNNLQPSRALQVSANYICKPFSWLQILGNAYVHYGFNGLMESDTFYDFMTNKKIVDNRPLSENNSYIQDKLNKQSDYLSLAQTLHTGVEGSFLMSYKGWNAIITASYYSALWRVKREPWHRSIFDGKFTFYQSLRKDFVLGKRKNGRFILANQFLFYGNDLQNGINGFKPLKNYYRLDLEIGGGQVTNQVNWSLGINIQNVTNHINESINTQFGGVGIIPVLSFKIAGKWGKAI